ncbi:hypothetical protein [Brevundimonas sp.]|uniref:hypothetical protein n=1 Tax=Brevundimonas sp. TaxID=1871086 RepID=UPI001A2A3346|nr:hypothetical protein [Brevundimonas sp.]MBJ7485961.1 hypothetical protein [Brevundimonas sp.]
MSDTVPSSPAIAPAADTVAAPKKPAPKRRTKPTKPVWVVRKGSGLEQLAADKAKKAIESGKVRAATERDLEIAGVPTEQR